MGFVFGVHGMSNQFIGKPNSFDITNGHTMKVLKGQEKQENPFIKRRVLIASKWSSSSPLLHCFCCYKLNHSVHERSQKFVKIVGWALHQMLKQRPPHKGGPARFVTGEKGAEEGDEILF